MLRHVLSNMYLTVTNEISTTPFKLKLGKLRKKKNIKSEYLLLKEYKKSMRNTINLQKESSSQENDDLKEKYEQSFMYYQQFDIFKFRVKLSSLPTSGSHFFLRSIFKEKIVYVLFS